MSFCEHCVKGVVHEGEPVGVMETVAGVPVYVARPKSGGEDLLVLIASDVFGLGLVNTKLLADSYAGNGFLTWVPDLFEGDAVRVTDMNQPGFSFEAWKTAHEPGPVLEKFVKPVIAAYKAAHPEGVVACLGFCYGGRLAVDLALERSTVATSIAHPSLLQLPEDMYKLASVYSDRAVQIHSCEHDPMFPPSAFDECDAAFQPLGTRYQRTYSPGCSHGFAVRGDLSIPHVKAAKETVFNSTVQFLKTHTK
ncbi:dienelactone hydrolase family protein [Gregarina niphandrodes]|uniref:Dienelactone hydrolase family protein n=1 Tax=Gregarina niphandrodes TaxID=110365 RepID=A0A023BD70_GRENI|nr:dienelactone hydrolase family protein [Gregarina niphandrodes]EZG86501.1 dienelactone hydrolase family protein [Gregarina niphandrodes]|eukprot:XP_011128758.1 dienelactone hydrolase family protein [Gregarina niphandrodes]